MSQFVTGCNKKGPGCPPGCQPIPEFPPVPAIPTSCLIMPHAGGAENTTIAGLFKVEDGTDDIIVWSETTGSFNGYIERWDKEFSVKRWRIDGETNIPYDSYYHNEVEFPGKVQMLSDGSLLHVHQYDISSGSYSTSSSPLLTRIDPLDGSIINYRTLDGPALVSRALLDPNYCDSIREISPGLVVCLSPQALVGGSWYQVLIFWNYIDDIMSAITVGTTYVSVSYSLAIGTTPNSALIVGYPYFDTNRTLYKNGKAYVTDTNTGVQTLLNDGANDPNPYSAIGYFNHFGYKIYCDDDNLVIFAGQQLCQTEVIQQYGHYYFNVYDPVTFEFKKRVIPPFEDETVMPTASIKYGSGFGKGFCRYGNFYYVGEPYDNWKIDASKSRGAVYVYDLNFNFIYEMKSLPLPTEGADSGGAVMVTDDRIYTVFSGYGDWEVHEVKVCTTGA